MDDGQSGNYSLVPSRLQATAIYLLEARFRAARRSSEEIPDYFVFADHPDVVHTTQYKGVSGE
jgi:hypothetical protein